MNTILKIMIEIEKLCSDRNISMHELLKKCNFEYLENEILKDPQALTINKLAVLCDGLGITLSQFFSAPEFDTLEQEIK